jgi:FAD/FMN-containing dehydrogenase
MSPAFDAPAAADELRLRFSGELVVPGDAGYDEARAVWNGTIDRRPSVIARCSSVDDVVAAVDVARRHRLTIAVRGGGHNVAGLASCDDGVVIDLSPMREVRVDLDRKLAFVQGGALWQDVDAATQVHALAAPAGLVSETGVGGLTLGGGMGWLRRKYGLTCDNLVGAEVVTATGRRVTVSENENSDLLWALRGGGGNFGVVTSFVFRLHPVGPEVSYSLVFYDGSLTAEGLRALRAYSAVAPDEISPVAFTAVVPEGMDGVPPELVGRPALVAAAVYVGAPEAGDELLRPMRELTTSLIDLSGRMPYVDLQRFLDEEYPRGRRYYWKSAVVNELSDGVIDVIVESAARQPSSLSTIDVWVMGGATAREPAGGSAYTGRDAGFVVNPEADWDDPADDAVNLAWARGFIAAMKPFTVGTYLNFPGMLEEGEAQLRSSFGGHYERLVAVKDKWDPGNLFRLNHNIVPSVKGRAA